MDLVPSVERKKINLFLIKTMITPTPIEMSPSARASTKTAKPGAPLVYFTKSPDIRKKHSGKI